MNTADVLVEMLQVYGVKHIFGVPGDTSMPFYNALYHAHDEISHIMARDERSASFMADAYARAGGPESPPAPHAQASAGAPQATP